MNLVDYAKAKAELAAKLAGKGQKMLADEFKTFLKENPTVEAVRWTQYTPHFNDGEPCEFGVSDFNIKFKESTAIVGYDGSITMSADEDDCIGRGFVEGYSLCNGKQTDPAVKAVGKNLEKLGKATSGIEDVFADAFGDGVQVTCTADGFDIDDYSHD